MKYILILLLFFTCTASAQFEDAKTLIVRGDTLIYKNLTTGEEIKLTKTVPSQAGQAGKVLSTNGTSYVWADAPTPTTISGSITQSQVTNLVADLAAKASTAAIPTNTNQLTNGSGFLTALTGTAAIGYTAGAGGTVTQATSKATGVTLNKLSGQITMNGAALAAAAEVAFTLTNSFIASTDVVIVNIQSVGTAGAYFVTVGAVSNGSCSITLGNVSAASLSQAVVLNFSIIKSSNN